MSDASGTTNYTYDSMDRLITKSSPEGILSYTYNPVGKLESINSNHAGGVSISYTYDSLNRLSSATDVTGSTAYAYDPANNLGSVTYPNGVKAQFTYDSLNRVIGLSSQVSGYTYQRGATGKLTSVTEQSGGTANWSYDGINRLTGETVTLAPSGNNGSVSYSLDPVGNRLADMSTLTGILSATSAFNADDEISSETYDANGNVTLTGGKAFIYDSENQLVSVNGGSVTLVYDGDGNRVAKTVNGVTTYYLLDDLNPTGYAQVVEELSSTGIVARQYTYGMQRISESRPDQQFAVGQFLWLRRRRECSSVDGFFRHSHRHLRVRRIWKSRPNLRFDPERVPVPGRAIR